jgi:hypothetical protein
VVVVVVAAAAVAVTVMMKYLSTSTCFILPSISI